MAKLSKAAQEILEQIKKAKKLTTISGLQNIPLDKIEEVSSWNSKKLKAATKQLKENTAKPIQVSFDELTQKYKIGDGIHRVRAAKELGLKEIPADVSKDTVHGLAKTTVAGAGLTVLPKEEDMKKDKKSLTEKAKEVGSKAAELGSAALEKLSVPQQILMRRTAQAMGVDGSDDISKSAENITEKIASKLGIPEDSEYVGPAAKAAIQTALEVGYDPVNLLGLGIVGKAAKGAQKSKVVQKVLGKLGKGEQALAKLPTMAAREEAVLAGKMRDIRAQEVADIKKQVRQMERAEALPVAEKKALLEKNMADEYKRVAERMKEVEKDKQYWQARQPQAVFPKATPAELLAERKQAAQIEARTQEQARKAQQEDLARQTKAIESEMPAIRAERAASLDKTPPLVPVSKSDEAKKLAEEILKKRKK